MFNVLKEWLIIKLGKKICSSLDYNNIGEKFKDGVLYAYLLQIYHVIPDSYVHDFKKTNSYASCLSNMKNINLWLKVLNIKIEDCDVHEIACGQSFAITKLLYQLYFKLEKLNHSYMLDDISKNKNEQTINNNSVNNIFKSNLSLNDKTTNKKEIPVLSHKTFNTSKLFNSSEGIQYTAIDVLKSTKNNNASKDIILECIQHNMNCFYNLFMQNINDKYFKNDSREKSNKIYKKILFSIQGTKEENILTDDELSNNSIEQINYVGLKINTHNETITRAQFNEQHQMVQNINYESDHLLHASQEDFKNENSTLNILKTEESISLSLDGDKSSQSEKQDILNEYLHHSGFWSAEYLNIDLHECKQDILSMVVNEVLNFEMGKSDVSFLKIKKTNVAGVVDITHNPKMVQLIMENLKNNGILSFTVDDAINACLNAYNEELKISQNKGKLYQVLGEHQVITEGKNNNKKQNIISDTNKNAIRKTTETNSTVNNASGHTNKNESNVITGSINEINEKQKFIGMNKSVQTPEDIPEPDYDNPTLSSMANMGKLIDEKRTRNHDLQMADVLNCIGEFIQKNHAVNGWMILEFPVQPLQMALLEYKLTGKMPYFGKELCKNTTRKSAIVPEYENTTNISILTHTYLSHCIKIVKDSNEIKNSKWNEFLQFYKEQNCMKVLISLSNNIIKQPKKAADILVGLILNENNDEKNESKNGNLFNIINMFNDGRHDSKESQNNIKKINEILSTADNKTDSIKTFLAKENNLDCSKVKSHLTNYTYNIILYMYDTWKTMEHNYLYQIKELMISKDQFFNEIKLIRYLTSNTVNETIQLDKPSTMSLINSYENSNKKLPKNTKNIKDTIFELQINLWDEVDSEFEQMNQFIKHTIDEQWITIKNNTLVNTYKQLLDTELKRTTISLNFLNMYYDGNNEHDEINHLNFCTDIIDNNNETDKFQTLCMNTIDKLSKYIQENYEELIEQTDQEGWTQSVHTEKNRFINQAYRLKASIILDKIYFDNLTKTDDFLEKIQTTHQLKINDINNVCEILKCAEDVEENIKVNITQRCGQFYVNEFNVLELICEQKFNYKEKFNIKQLKRIVNKLLDDFPGYKIPFIDLIKTLNELNKIQCVYPKNWPTDDQFHYHLTKSILGSSVIAIDWRDFVVQCMELSYPSINQILYYRNLFQGSDLGNEIITEEKFESTKLWFEGESNQHDEAKWLLYDMYQVQSRLNYSAMLLAFCRDKEPWMGLSKSFGLIFGCNPFDLKELQIFQNNSQYEGLEIDPEDLNKDTYLSDLSDEVFIFDKNIMTWFLITNLKLYISDGTTQLGNIYISQIVETVFAQIKIEKLEVTFMNLFQNNEMNHLYNTVHKFQTTDLSEVVKNIVMKYNLHIKYFTHII